MGIVRAESVKFAPKTYHMAYIKILKDNELIGGQDDNDVYPVTTTQAIYSQGVDGSKAIRLEDRLAGIEGNMASPITETQIYALFNK